MRLKTSLFLIFLLASRPALFSQQKTSDINSRINGDFREDTVSVNSILSRCDTLFRINPAECFQMAEKALDISAKLKFRKGEALSNKYLGLGKYVEGEYVKAIGYYQESLDIYQELNDKKGIANILSNMGAIYNNEGNDAKALELFLKSLKLSEEINDSLRSVTVLSNIGLIYSKKEGTSDKAKEHYLRALNIAEKINYQIAVGTVSVNLGELLFAKGDYKQALTYFNKSLDAYKKANSGNIPYTLINIGKIYLKWHEFENAVKIEEEALKIAEITNSKLESGQALLSLGNTYLEKGDLLKAIDYYKRAEHITMEIGARNERKDIYDGMAKSYALKGDYVNAFNFKMLESKIKDTLYSEASLLQLSQLQIQYEIESMLKENEILKRDVKLREAKSRTQMLAIVFLIVGIFLTSALLVQLARVNNHKKRANAILTEKNTLITAQKKAITDSISYAGRIQHALLTPDEIVSRTLPESFIFYRPRDIVSGDFYWMTKTHHRTFCVAADCTGHGVPGAFMSMLGISFLNEIISASPELQAHELLNELRIYVIKSLHQNVNLNIGETKDGMDLALLIFDDKMENVQFAGANNPLVIIRGGEVLEYKADKMPIGVHLHSDTSFNSHDVHLQKNDMLYIFSDGYIDQFGGHEGKKFMSKNFKLMLSEIAPLQIAEQRKSIETRLDVWKGEHDQVDDILVMGIRIV
jgi:serine phosphatase RsbU (regulator of sigma subunit)/Tfp pilus assembly protein PilF